MSQEKIDKFSEELKLQLQIIGIFIAIFWGVEIIDQAIFAHRLDSFGIIPRNLTGLRGVILSPFLHADFGHLLANTFPFIILGWFVMLQRTSDFFTVSLYSMLSSGLGVWLFASPGSVTVGASGVIFGYLGFLMFRGYFQRNIPSIALSLLVIFLYGGMIWGVLPSNPHVSWLAHLFGFIGGIWTAKTIAQKG